MKLLFAALLASQATGFFIAPHSPRGSTSTSWTPRSTALSIKYPTASALCSTSAHDGDTKEGDSVPPNILLIMVDQLSRPSDGHGKDDGFHDDLKKILRFDGGPDDDPNAPNEYRKYFPGLWRLRDNSVVFDNHRAATSACVPSRTVLFSGQYGTVTGVTQTDGVFKNGADPRFKWLNGSRFPTIGDWLRKVGYSTHYFGKWHISGEDTEDLEEFGFSDWELSYPDPHGTLPNNLGHYRDYQFRDLITSFLNRQGLGIPYNIKHAKHNVVVSNFRKGDDDSVEDPEGKPPAPWFAVASFTNPHDIASYPDLPRTVHNCYAAEGANFTLGVPPKGAIWGTPTAGTMKVELNTKDFPQDNANNSPTWDEDITGPNANKPSCQADYLYKMGYTLTAKGGYNFAKDKDIFDDHASKLEAAVRVATATELVGIPFRNTSNPELACSSFMQYYGYVISEVDQHIDATLQALEDSGQADNTIVIFTADHGEYGGAHQGMMEKWHSAYEENTHIPLVVRFPKSLHNVTKDSKYINEPTNHADIMPTILGLADVDGDERKAILDDLLNGHGAARAPVGEDLSQLIYGKETQVVDSSTKKQREGVLFMTHDTISEPIDPNEAIDGEDELSMFQVYCATIDKAKEQFPHLAPGSVRHPCLVHSVVNTDNWKLVKYFTPDPDDETNYKKETEFELYDLNKDKTEALNLVSVASAKDDKVDTPTLIHSLKWSDTYTEDYINQQLTSLMTLMENLENKMLLERPTDTA